MSAYVVDTAHIDALIRFAIFGNRPLGVYFNRERIDDSNASAIGSMLLGENITSVSHCYSHRDDKGLSDDQVSPKDYVYRYHRNKAQLTPVQVLKALDGYEYQACEHPGWATSDAKDFCDRLRKAAIGKLPGYEEAEWEITS